MKRKKIIRAKGINKIRSFFGFRAAAVMLILLFVGNYSLSLFNRSTYRLTEIRVPKIASVEFPDPLELVSLSSFVLGAQPVDPQEFLAYINSEREKTGANSLRMNTQLMKAAQMRADVIMKYENFSHYDPYEHIELVTVLPKVNYHYVYASENIGMGGPSAKGFVDGFMNSLNHRNNLLSPGLSDTGVGVAVGPYKQYYVNVVVQLFAIPAGKAEYLGYTKDDMELYKEQLSAIDAKLHPVVWTFGQLTKERDFTDVNRKKLVRKREILSALYSVMKEEKPLTNSDVALILEYNKTLN